ncbi:TLD domain-containing protein 2 [Astathelohania contejeani]|uniref:Oxidation resistance protein 1 n=1 Tax=Astathelohania contejeani TaxID=164912 RepID=A0ABQ7I0G9_9MICR|nr:TLD domain-containing protein 2 [Thelohania contejeani]
MDYIRKLFKKPEPENESKIITEVINFQLLYKNKKYTNTLLTDTIVKQLKSHFEQRYITAECWVLTYSTIEHGCSLRTMLGCLKAHKHPYVIICQDMTENIFGVFFDNKIEISLHTFGNASTFLFKRNKKDEIIAYHSTLINRYFCVCNPDYLAFGVGEGRYGLVFNKSMLDGETCKVNTFNNELLTDNEYFKIKYLEVWSIKL